MLPASFFSLISDLQSAQPQVIMVIPYCEHHVHTSLGPARSLAIQSYQSFREMLNMLQASFFSLIPDQHSAQPHVIMVVPYCEHNVHTPHTCVTVVVDESGGSSLRATKEVKHQAKSISRIY